MDKQAYDDLVAIKIKVTKNEFNLQKDILHVTYVSDKMIKGYYDINGSQHNTRIFVEALNTIGFIGYSHSIEVSGFCKNIEADIDLKIGQLKQKLYEMYVERRETLLGMKSHLEQNNSFFK